MDIDIENRVNEALRQLRSQSIHDVDLVQMDPIARMMFVALVNECQKIQDSVDQAADKIVERFCTDFIPFEKVEAIPAIAVLKLDFKKKGKNLSSVIVESNTDFVYKEKEKTGSASLTFIPLFRTRLMPPVYDAERREYEDDTPLLEKTENKLWMGIKTGDEIDSLKGLSLLLKGTNGILPDYIRVGTESRELSFSTMSELENVGLLEPFDAQQSSGKFFSLIRKWREKLLDMEDAALLYVTDDTRNRDLFKQNNYPKVLGDHLAKSRLQGREGNILWLQLEFPSDYVVPETCSVAINVVPVVNVDVSSVTLNQSSPIAKLQKQDDSFFLQVIETSSSFHRQGFDMMADEIVVRDFDASCYHNGHLYRDVRNLYNQFKDNYYAFIEYNKIKDGEALKRLRETIHHLWEGVDDKRVKNRFDSGTYVMKNISNSPQASTTKVSFMTTQGRKGNTPRIGETMESKKLPSIEPKATVVVSAMGGADKASVDERYELLRYYSLTNDRLYTKMDIDAFLRKTMMAEFGKSEFDRIFIKISIEGAGGRKGLQRGLYIDIAFKDKKNYEKARQGSLDKQLKHEIEIRSCISMPIIVSLVNLEA